MREAKRNLRYANRKQSFTSLVEMTPAMVELVVTKVKSKPSTGSGHKYKSTLQRMSTRKLRLCAAIAVQIRINHLRRSLNVKFVTQKRV